MFLKSYFFHIGLECSSNKLFYCSRFRLNPLENELVNERSCFLFTLVLCTQVKLSFTLVLCTQVKLRATQLQAYF